MHHPGPGPGPARESSIRHKLGLFLGGLGPSRPAPLPARGLDELGRPDHAIFFTDDVLRVRGAGAGGARCAGSSMHGCHARLPCRHRPPVPHPRSCAAFPVQELESGAAPAQRVRAMKELHEIVASKRLEKVRPGKFDSQFIVPRPHGFRGYYIHV